MRLIIHAVYDSCDFFNGIPILLRQVFQLSACFRETNNRIFIRTHVARMGGKFASPRCRNSLRKAFVEFYLREKGIYFCSTASALFKNATAFLMQFHAPIFSAAGYHLCQ